VLDLYLKRVLWIVLLMHFLSTAALDLHAGENSPSELKTGPYLEIGGQTDPAAVGVGLGGFKYNYRYLSTRLALYVLGSESIDDIFFGADAGFRLDLGTLVSPFVGLGGYYGYHTEYVPAEDDKLDNDGDGQVDEAGEQDAQIDRSVASIYPEAGVHIWIDRFTRFSLSGKYHVTTEGRNSDFWLFCVGFSFATQ